jgi:3-dehydroquinate synthase II/3-amino-4-hydroxybenzoic acid synthase
MGHRACVDTISLLTTRDAFVVGTTSAGGLLACSETHPLPYMNVRPFRVNAGAIHSYVWGPDNVVEYLSELKTGSRVLCVDIDGETRVVHVGRVKIELRPLMLIEARAERTISAIVQDDWHIRLFRDDGEPASATALKPGDRLLAHVTEPGRHVGLFVKENIIER